MCIYNWKRWNATKNTTFLGIVLIWYQSDRVKIKVFFLINQSNECTDFALKQGGGLKNSAALPYPSFRKYRLFPISQCRSHSIMTAWHERNCCVLLFQKSKENCTTYIIYKHHFFTPVFQWLNLETPFSYTNTAFSNFFMYIITIYKI